MIYTAQEGVNRQTKQKILTAQLIILPLLMFAITAIGFNGTNQPANNEPRKTPGVTLGTDTSSSDNSSSTLTTPGGTASGGSGDSSTDSSNGVFSPILGGRGSAGGSRTGGGTASTTPSTPQPSPPPPPAGGRGGGDTIVCDNTGGIQPITCTVCTPPLVVLVGQKVLLSNGGTCTLVN